MLKVVIDTNQFVSSLISRKGASAKLLTMWRQHEFLLILSREIVEEIHRVLSYSSIVQKYKITKKDTESLSALIEHEAIVLPQPPAVNVIKDDPDDNKILACALAVKADFIVSGDKDLLRLQKFENTMIVNVSEFLKILETKGHK